MAKVSVIFVIYEGRRFIKPVFDAATNQTHKDLEVIAVINKSTDGGKEEIQKNYPQVKIIDQNRNMGFAEGNNVGILASAGEFIQLVNQDLILEPTYIEQMVKAFANPKIAAATGKLLRFDFEKNEKTNIIDSTGVIVSNSGRAKDRGQTQIDSGQFDLQNNVFAVSGAAPMYRRSALEKVRYQDEYFDQDFFMYWEDVDLSWRLNRAGFKNVYVPSAVGYHGRTAGQAEGGYLHLFKFIQHHGKLSKQIKRWNYKNHILMYLKNTPRVSLSFILREIAMFGYIVIFETSTLGVIPELFRQMKTLKLKRQIN
jgi:GT2 family glycosyltransferase